jgi:hypothetical protein
MARTKIPIALRIDPELKAMAEARAKEERRSFAGFVEWLIAEDAKRTGSARQAGTQPAPQHTAASKERTG